MPDLPPSPPPPPPPLPPSAPENKRFETPPDPFAGVAIPDKFKKDGKPDLAALVTSYGDLETRFLTKTEDLKRQIAEETLKERPKDAASYALPRLEGVDEKELAEHPMIGWWREQAFEAGLPQKKFEAAIASYIEKMQPAEIPEDKLKAELGDGFKTRIAAVDAWAQKTAKDATELEALRRAATDPAGIRMLERLAGLAAPLSADSAATVTPALTAEQLRAMQADPRYWNPMQRDPGFVKQVEDGYKKLYPDARKSA